MLNIRIIISYTSSSSAEPEGCIKKRIGNEWAFVKLVGIIDIKQEILRLKKHKAKYEMAITDIQKKLEGKAAEKMAEEAKIENEQKLEKNKHDIIAIDHSIKNFRNLNNLVYIQLLKVSICNPENTEINLLCLWLFPIFCELRVTYILELIYYWFCYSSKPNRVVKVAYFLLTWKYFLKKMQWAFIIRRKEVIYLGYINLIKLQSVLISVYKSFFELKFLEKYSGTTLVDSIFYEINNN